MDVSAPMLIFGLVLTAVGTVMLLLSFRPTGRGEKLEHRGAGVIFIGPIPIVFGGRGRWAVIGVAVAAIALLLVVASMNPDIIGW